MFYLTTYVYFLDLGPGWDVATIDDNKEFKFFSHVHRFSLDQSTYFVGGMTDVTPNTQDIRQYGWPDNGNILFSLQTNNIVMFHKSNAFQLIDTEIKSL